MTGADVPDGSHHPKITLYLIFNFLHYSGVKSFILIVFAISSLLKENDTLEYITYSAIRLLTARRLFPVAVTWSRSRLPASGLRTLRSLFLQEPYSTR